MWSRVQRVLQVKAAYCRCYGQNLQCRAPFPRLLTHQQAICKRTCWTHFSSHFLMASGRVVYFSVAFQKLQCLSAIHNLAARLLSECCQWYLIWGSAGWALLDLSFGSGVLVIVVGAVRHSDFHLLWAIWMHPWVQLSDREVFSFRL